MKLKSVYINVSPIEKEAFLDKCAEVFQLGESVTELRTKMTAEGYIRMIADLCFGLQSHLFPTGDFGVFAMRAGEESIKPNVWRKEIWERLAPHVSDKSEIIIHNGNTEIHWSFRNRKLIDETAEPESKVWHPEDGERVWKLYSDGSSDTVIFLCNGDSTENSWKQGNVFATKEAAEFEANRRRIITELRRHAEEFNTAPIDWHDYEQDKWHLAYYNSRPHGCQVYPSLSNAIASGDSVYFTSESIANAAIEKIGEDNLIKYYFCINN